jgi:hypothetical protein
MFHLIEFTDHIYLDLEQSRQHRVEKLLLRPGSRLCVQMRPYVLESPVGPIEVADLFLDDGSTASAVPFASFRMVESIR